MLFNSYEFLFIYLPIVLATFYGLCKLNWLRLAIWWIGLASLAFYGLWRLEFLPVLLASIGFNYLAGWAIVEAATPARKRCWLILGLAVNLGALGFFKYTGFFADIAMDIADTRFAIPDIVLPIGISFFTFTQIAFLVDCWRGSGKRYPFSDYLAFVTFFPHLVAGPILNHRSFIPQLERKRFGVPGTWRLYIATIFFAVGLFKKVIIADSISPYVGPLFDHATALSTVEAWAAALLYTFQLYFDFSGYSDMAIGLGLMLNLRIPFNFHSPYKARSIIDFWHRWHMSLSAFLRDYLYIPLGGNRRGKLRRYLNLLATMLLGGLWHGAGWSFLVWGGLHGLYLVINHLWRSLGRSLPVAIAWPVTFLCVVVAWVFFRAKTLADATAIIASMAGFAGTRPQGPALLADPGMVFVAILGMILWTALAPNTQQIAFGMRPRRSFALAAATATAVSVLSLGKVSEFLYFQF